MQAAPIPPVVFLVDDEEVVLKALSRMLRASGFEVRAWSDPQKFLAEQAMKAGAFTFLFKPVRIDEFAATVRAAIQKDADGRKFRRQRAA